MAPPLSSLRRSVWMSCTAGILLIALHIATFAVHTDRSARAFDARVISAAPGMTAPRFFLDHDSYAWLAHTRDLMNSGDWRIRHTFMDNAPFGRAMHWSHPLLWGLRGLTSLFMHGNQWPLARALDLAGVWIMPAFQFLVLSLAFCLFLRKLGWGTAGLFVFLCLSLEPLYSVFYPLKPDHHGLQIFSAFLSFFCLVLGGMGWVRADANPAAAPPLRAFIPLSLPSPVEARSWFAAAGLFGALSLWLGATVWIFCFAITVAGALWAMPFWKAAAPPKSSYLPALWRIWATVGAIGSCVFYLLEYAPRHFAMRLEVNHPLYWLCWLGVAEAMVFAGGSSSLRFWQHRSGGEWTRLALGLLAGLSLPLLILFGPSQWHLMRNPVTYLWNDRVIAEFTPGLLFAMQNLRPFLLSVLGVIPVAMLALFWSRPAGEPSSPARRAFAVLTILFAVLFLRQLRWMPYFALSLTTWTLLMLNQRLSPVGRRSSLGLVLCGALLLNGLWADAERLRKEAQTALAIHPPESWGKALGSKHTALRTGLVAGTNQWRMIGTPDEAPCLYYFAGIPSVASFYWENIEGWQDEIAFYCDNPDGDVAAAIVHQRGLTHALVLLEPERNDLFVVASAVTSPSPTLLPQHTLADRMAHAGKPSRLPPWMSLDRTLSKPLSERILLQTPEGVFHLQKPFTFYALSPAPPPEPSSD